MTQKIIALVDGSVYAKAVCEQAAWAATRMGAAVELLHVLGRREGAGKSDLSGAMGLGVKKALLEELATLDEQRSKLVAHRGRAILAEARAILDAAGVNEITTSLRHGDIVETVAEQEKDASLIMIGKRGEASDYAKEHLGSNLERIVRASTKPVFVASRTWRAVHKVLIAYDGGPSAIKAVEHVARNPLFTGLAVQIASVGTATAEVKKGLEDAAAVTRTAGLATETVVVPGQPDTALPKLVEEAEVDMVVMGAYGHSRMRTLIIGSTTTGMIRSCKVPLLLVR